MLVLEKQEKYKINYFPFHLKILKQKAKSQIMRKLIHLEGSKFDFSKKSMQLLNFYQN